jgi:hypothetical protein
MIQSQLVSERQFIFMQTEINEIISILISSINKLKQKPNLNK